MATAAAASIGTKIIAVGRNYAAHAKELGNAVPKEPVLFLKPTSSYLADGGTIEIPGGLEALDHEVELAVVVGRKGRDVAESAATEYIGGYALALDMTVREIQSKAKAQIVMMFMSQNFRLLYRCATLMCIGERMILSKELEDFHGQ